MNREELRKQKYRELWGEQQPSAGDDSELQTILNRFLYGEVYQRGKLTGELRELITIAVLTAVQDPPQLRIHIAAALHIGVAPASIQEAVLQCAPYIGFPKTLRGIDEVNEVFREQNIPLPLEPQGTVDENTRFEKGLAVQKSIFGETIDVMRANAPKNQRHIQDYLSAYCFGDFYTRGCLNLPARELLTLCILTALGGCENQVKAHVQANSNVGNSRDTLIDAITQCLPYVGFPRTLNALSCVNEMIPEEA